LPKLSAIQTRKPSAEIVGLSSFLLSTIHLQRFIQWFLAGLDTKVTFSGFFTARARKYGGKNGDLALAAASVNFWRARHQKM
jgi:hypothetical protein